VFLRRTSSGVSHGTALAIGATAGIVGLLVGASLSYLRMIRGAVVNGNTPHAHRQPDGLKQEMDRHRETNLALQESREMFHLLVESVEDYAIFMMDPNGKIVSWNKGAQRIKGYSADDIIGKMYSQFYTEEDRAVGRPQYALGMATTQGHFEGEGWRVRKDGTRFWANFVITSVKDEAGNHIGFAKVTRDATERRAAEEALHRAKIELEHRVVERMAAIKELEAFSYSVSHDLRAPLRQLQGLSQALLEDYLDKFDDEGRTYLEHILNSGRRMELLVDELLKLSQLTTGALERQQVNLGEMVREIARELQTTYPTRAIEFVVGDTPSVVADVTLLRAALYNLLDNSVKFTRHRDLARIEFGTLTEQGELVYFVRDNGVGFDPSYADRLFGPFQRLHTSEEFEGTGIGLATIQRIIRRHGGRVWAEAEVGSGATFYFTLPEMSDDEAVDLAR
jgi:PAS domain S-box-containing protein